MERLYQDFRLHSTLGPEALKNQRMIAMMFIGQSYADIRKRLQKLEGRPREPLAELLKVANKVYRSREKKGGLLAEPPKRKMRKKKIRK